MASATWLGRTSYVNPLGSTVELGGDRVSDWSSCLRRSARGCGRADRLAVDSVGEVLTYPQLNARTNQLAVRSSPTDRPSVLAARSPSGRSRDVSGRDQERS
jgi:hypothetical protein